MSRPPPKRLAALAEMLVELRDMATLETQLERAIGKRQVWREVGDWADAVARKHGLEQFLHGARLPGNREHPATDGPSGNTGRERTPRPMQPIRFIPAEPRQL